jgi:hypothetical protein
MASSLLSQTERVAQEKRQASGAGEASDVALNLEAQLTELESLSIIFDEGLLQVEERQLEAVRHALEEWQAGLRKGGYCL